jgi:hypothetical protein
VGVQVQGLQRGLGQVAPGLERLAAALLTQSSRPSMMSAQWKRQGLGTASTTWLWRDRAASSSSVGRGTWVMPNSTTRRGKGPAK